MFHHSVKVPRHFKIAANIVKKVTEEGGSIKTLLYDDKLKHFRTNVLYALVNETIKHAVDIEKIFESTGILVKEPRLDPWLARVLTAELIYGIKSLPGKSKPEQTILAYKEQFEKYTPEDNQKTQVRRPRYVRVNTNLLSTSDAIRAFQDEGYKFIRCTSGPYNDYLQTIHSLTEYDFTQDYHVKTILVFAPGIKWHEHELYLENKIILQDKATALPVHLLAPPPGSVVLDMCAAPGMKTTQLAAYMRNEGKIYAVERIESRYETLCQFVKATGCKCVETFHIDALQIKRGDLDDVQYILLDPSCSGSGMELCAHSYMEESRLKKLTNFQEKFLKHAMNSFPNAKRIVYSTCSVLPEENERVITNIVKASRAKWRVRDVKDLLKGQWNNLGSGMYGSIGTRCIYARPDTDFTTGFFVAVLDRELSEKQQTNKTNKILEDQGENVIKLDNNDKKDNNESDDEKQISKKNKRKKRSDDDCNTEYVTNSKQSQNNINNEYDFTKTKKKKRTKSALEYESSPSEKTNHFEKSKQNEVPNCKKKKQNQDITISCANFNENINCDEIMEISEENHESQNLKAKKKKLKERENKALQTVNELHENITCEEVIQISEESNLTQKLKKKKNKRETQIFESGSETCKHKRNGNISGDEIIEISEESNRNQYLKKKKKKRRENKNKTLESINESVIDISTDMENITFEDNQLYKPKMKRKNRKEPNDETLEAVAETLIQISSDAEQDSKKGKKRINRMLNESSIIEITEEQKLNDFNEIETLGSQDLLADKAHNKAKSKRKKQKFREEEIDVLADTLTTADKYEHEYKKGDKNCKKTKRDRDSNSVFIFDATQCVTKSKTDKSENKKRDFKDVMFEINEQSEYIEVPKKKKKKRELEIS